MNMSQGFNRCCREGPTVLHIHFCSLSINWWRHGVVVITTTQLHSTKPEFRFCAGSNPAHGMSEIRDGEDL